MLLRVHRIFQGRAMSLLQRIVDALIEGPRRHFHLHRVQLRVQFPDRGHNLFYLRVAEVQRFHNRFLGNFQRA